MDYIWVFSHPYTIVFQKTTLLPSGSRVKPLQAEDNHLLRNVCPSLKAQSNSPEAHSNSPLATSPQLLWKFGGSFDSLVICSTSEAQITLCPCLLSKCCVSHLFGRNYMPPQDTNYRIILFCPLTYFLSWDKIRHFII